MDAKLQQLGLSRYATHIKACASDIDTLRILSVSDLMNCRAGPRMLNRAQAKYIVRKVQQSLPPKEELNLNKLQEQISDIDKKLKNLGLGEYASVIKACASDVGTLPFVTVDDLMNQENSPRPLTKAQARLVVERCTPKKKRAIKPLSEKRAIKPLSEKKPEIINKATPKKKIIKLTSPKKNERIIKVTTSKKNERSKSVHKKNIIAITPTKKLQTVVLPRKRTTPIVLKRTPTKKAVFKNPLDLKIHQLGLSRFAPAIKECASGVDTLTYVTVDDLTSSELDVAPLTNIQARLVVQRLKKLENCENSNPNFRELCSEEKLAQDLDKLEILQRENEADAIYNCFSQV